MNLRIADFGFSSSLMGRDGTGFMKTVLGTEGYMAPEII
jgi:serine/threonine protein kinase